MPERNPKNACGPFYVVNAQCISCGAPRAEAPALITMDDDVGCYFHRQPETPQEVDAAIRAVFVSCVEAYRYAGDDHRVRRRLAELGHADLCDRPLLDQPEVVRNHVRFEYGGATTACGLACLLRDWFLAKWKDGSGCPRDVDGDDDHAAFEFTASIEYGTPLAFVVDRLGEQQWLLRNEAGRGRPIWVHDVLAARGAAGIRWFSASEWERGANGEPLPY